MDRSDPAPVVTPESGTFWGLLGSSHLDLLCHFRIDTCWPADQPHPGDCLDHTPGDVPRLLQSHVWRVTERRNDVPLLVPFTGDRASASVTVS